MAIKMSFVFGPVASIVSVLDNAKVSYAIIFPVTVDMINFTLGLGTGVEIVCDPMGKITLLA